MLTVLDAIAAMLNEQGTIKAIRWRGEENVIIYYEDVAAGDAGIVIQKEELKLPAEIARECEECRGSALRQKDTLHGVVTYECDCCSDGLQWEEEY